jgi:hypothetical protein
MSRGGYADVSVVLPTWNRPRFLRATIDSVLSQTEPIRELLIADDGSDAPTRTLLQEYTNLPQVRVLWRSHCGNPGALRNAAIREARGRYIAFADSDDLWHVDKLARQLAALRARPDCRWCYSASSCIDEYDRTVLEQDPAQQLRRGSLVESLATFSTTLALPSVIAERSLLFQAGLFDESMRCYADYHLWIRLAGLSDGAALTDSLVSVRRHESHFSRGDAYATAMGRHRYLRQALTQVRSRGVRARLQRMLALDSARLVGLAVESGEDGDDGCRLRRSLLHGWAQPRWWLIAARVQSRRWRLRLRRSGMRTQ